MISIETNDDEIKIMVDGALVAFAEDCGNGMQAELIESDIPMVRLGASDLIAFAQFILNKAKERAENEEMK